MTFIQRYARAAISSDLTSDAYHSDTDRLAAAALSGEDGAASRTLGTLLFRVKFSNDASSYSMLLSKWVEIVTKKASNRDWPTNIKPAIIADKSLSFWVNDVCPACTGKKYEAVANVPNVLSDNLCRVCDGTGRKPVICGFRERDYVKNMVNELGDIIHSAAGQAMNKLKDDMDLL